tara:strand:- start:1982 stop:2086 length:105 start_codon:yes stop_codon:yes gene_type:complete
MKYKKATVKKSKPKKKVVRKKKKPVKKSGYKVKY